MKSLMDRIKAIGGIMSSADWAQTVFFLTWLLAVLAWITVFATRQMGLG